ncbi:hypothetical protein [Candidatus Odyssella thessalonicensis]|uniref:hypothetical protein n=1 Tax=Candidatus Odyssella thessalonicensis TaxID=84647 RepID=UPI000225B1B2|nr:hypothetical protein [Candidatus Odyssella thessalonicensis]
MQTQRIILLASLICQLASLSGATQPAEKIDRSHCTTTCTQSPVDKLETLHLEIQKVLDAVEENPAYKIADPRVVVIGNTGAGKTTLLHLLAGRNLIAQQISNMRRYQLTVAPEDVLPGFQIGHGIRAGTGLPVSWHDKVHNTVYWDCPGFGDPAGPEREIINAFAIYQLFKSSVPARIVLVATESEADFLTARATNFLRLLKRVTDVVSPADTTETSLLPLSLIITKQRDYEPQELIEHLSWALEDDNTHELHHSQISALLKTLLPSGRSASLPIPTKPGSYTCEARESIVEMILSTLPIVAPTVNIELSAEAKLLLIEYSRNLNERIINFIDNDIAYAVINYCHQQIDNHQGTVSNLRLALERTALALSNFKDGLAKLKTVEEDNLKVELDNLFATKLESLFPAMALRKMIEMLSFLKKIDKTIEYNVDPWVLKHDSIYKKISELIQVKSNSANGQLRISGVVIGMSDLGSFDLSSIKQVDIMALNTFIIDKDGRYPGLSFNIIAPIWKTFNNKLIDLSGLPGANGSDALGLGQDGQPGQAGEDGGNFYGKGRIFFSLGKLTIKSNGGSGGGGGHGRDGTPGKDGKDGNPASKTKSVGNIHYFHDRGTDGQAGGNGGRGGHGGRGGFKGDVTIEGNSEWQLVAADGLMGAHGKGGKGGIGGRHGRHCQGTLVTDRVKEEEFQTVRMITGRTEVREELVEREKLPTWVWFWPFGQVAKVAELFEDKYYTRQVTVDLPDLPVIDTGTRTVAAEDLWQVQPGYQGDRGKAPDGFTGSGLNTEGQPLPSARKPINKVSTLATYNSYHQAAKNSSIYEFVKEIN